MRDAKEAIDPQWIDLAGDIRITDEEPDAIITADDIDWEGEDLASGGVKATDDVFPWEDDVIASNEEGCAVDDGEVDNIRITDEESDVESLASDDVIDTDDVFFWDDDVRARNEEGCAVGDGEVDDIRISDEKSDIIVSEDDISAEIEGLASGDVIGTNDVFFWEDDARVREEESCAVDDGEVDDIGKTDEESDIIASEDDVSAEIEGLASGDVIGTNDVFFWEDDVRATDDEYCAVDDDKVKMIRVITFLGPVIEKEVNS